MSIESSGSEEHNGDNVSNLTVHQKKPKQPGERGFSHGVSNGLSVTRFLEIPGSSSSSQSSQTNVDFLTFGSLWCWFHAGHFPMKLFVGAMLFASAFSHNQFLLENRSLLQPRTDKWHLHARSQDP